MKLTVTAGPLIWRFSRSDQHHELAVLYSAILGLLTDKSWLSLFYWSLVNMLQESKVPNSIDLGARCTSLEPRTEEY